MCELDPSDVSDRAPRPAGYWERPQGVRATPGRRVRAPSASRPTPVRPTACSDAADLGWPPTRCRKKADARPPSRPIATPAGATPVTVARTWLARVGWLRHGRIDPAERP